MDKYMKGCGKTINHFIFQMMLFLACCMRFKMFKINLAWNLVDQPKTIVS